VSRLLASLESATLDELRAEWGRRYGAPPRLRSADLMRQVLAWRIQSASEGGLDKGVKRLLHSDASASRVQLPMGTIIAREWKGVRHEVEVADGGYIHASRRWNSLSEIASAITGTRWNGPRFFGLRGAA
jgi:hypothetical protein